MVHELRIPLAWHWIERVRETAASVLAGHPDELARAVDALWGEMQLAKKIQTALIPVKTELQGCEIAAAMRPADEVGGDYYDVVRVGGVEWILIGDVSGHGVPAGLVMTMCQTAVRAILGKHPDLMRGELLAHVNKTLTENIRRLGETKYMTLQAVRRDPNGGFAHAGLHQDLLIYRAAERRVEVVKSRGMWLGAKQLLEEGLRSAFRGKGRSQLGLARVACEARMELALDTVGPRVTISTLYRL